MDATKRSSAAVWAVALIVLLPVLYLASLGPVFWLDRHALGPESPSLDPYAIPADWLCEWIPAIEPPLERYVDWWAD